MYSLSTAWNCGIHDNGIDIVNEIKSVGFDTVELNFALTKSTVDQIVSLKDGGEISVSSLHNICPLPDGVEPAKASPDHYSLASPDEEERKRAVDVTKNTIDYAKRLGAKAVVIHAGRVEIKDRTRELANVFTDTTRYDKLKKDMFEERDQLKGAYLDSIIVSIGELTSHAQEAGIALCLENRYYFREIPLIDEMEVILRNFRRAPVYYWHDVGHAEVFDRLGITPHGQWLDKFGDRLIGVHLHDIIDFTDDHKPPGAGTFDFNIIRPYINQNTIKVIEIHQPAAAEDIRKAVRYLDSILE